MVAQQITLQAPDLVRRLIVVGTGPRGGQGMESLTQPQGGIFGATYDPPENVWLAVFFTPSAAEPGGGTGVPEAARIFAQENRDPKRTKSVARPGRSDGEMGRPAKGILRLSEEDQAANTRRERQQRRDRLTVNSFIMQQNMPNAQLILYPDSNHGAHHMYPELFVRHVSMFLSE